MKQIWEENFNDLYRNFEDMQNHCEYLENENNKLQSNWNSLREWLEEQNKFYEISTMGYSYGVICNVLDKMNELEGKNKE